MNETSKDGTTAGAVPIVFNAAGSWCFGWFHAARPPARKVGVVLCRPFGYEAILAYRAYTCLAEMLAQAGFDVMRFDYHGTGDSAGCDADPGRVPAWIDSIAAAVGELKRLGAVTRIALFGLRLGATLAAQAAARLGGVDALVMWAPCTGRAFVRELRAASATRATAGDGETGDIESLGYLYTERTQADLRALDGQFQDVPPARRALIIGRDDMPGEGPWPARYRSMGIDATSTAWPGYEAMMVEPHEAVLPQDTLASITQWLAAAPEPAWAPEPRQACGPAAVPPVDSVFDGVSESALMFGADRGLFGILAEPAAWQAGDRRAETAILLLSVGGNYRIGPNRNYVKFSRSLAAAGYRALRLDLSGIGDSRTAVGFSKGSLYSKSSTADVSAAIDCLAERGCKRFFLMGICSGSYVAFQTALVDARVTGQILINSRLLEYQQGGSWQDAMQRGYKSTDFYRRALLDPQVYRRVLRGEVDVAGIAARYRSLIQARLKRALDRLLRRPASDEGLVAKVRQLSARGTHTLLIIAAADDGRDYLEFHFGRLGHRMRGDSNFRMLLAEDCDHTFSRSENQQFVVATLREHLETRTALPPDDSQAGAGGAKLLGLGGAGFSSGSP